MEQLEAEWKEAMTQSKKLEEVRSRTFDFQKTQHFLSAYSPENIRFLVDATFRVSILPRGVRGQAE